MKKETYYIIRKGFYPVYECKTMKNVMNYINKHYPDIFTVEKYIKTKSYKKLNHVRKVFTFKPIMTT